MMKVSSRYGKKMGRMGTLPWSSAPGAAFARHTAEAMNKNPRAASAMLDRIFKKAKDAGMSSHHLDRLHEVGGRINRELVAGASRYGGANRLKWF
jgi:hypothetical protein